MGNANFPPERESLVDNVAIIAYIGEIEFKPGIFVKDKEIEALDINP